MKKMKKIWMMLICVFCVCSAICFVAGKEEVWAETRDYTYRELEDGTVEITGYNGNETTITIPEEIDGKAVTSIAGNSGFTSPFSGWESIAFPNSITNIGDWAFNNCSRLKSIAIPNRVTSIGRYAFSNCSSLKSITLPSSVANIGTGAFSKCSSLDSITIPSGVTNIGAVAFSGCSNLTSITIPGSVTSIGGDAFFDTKWLENKLQISSLVIVNDILIAAKSSLESVTIPSSVTSIGGNAFKGCSSVTGIELPGSVTSIGANAFWGCTSLKSITIPNSVTNIGATAFFECSSLESIELPGSVTSVGEGAFVMCSSLKNITLPDCLTSIGESAFMGCSAMESITIPKGVASIGFAAFHGCGSLKNIQYTGSETQWKQIIIEDDNDALQTAAVQYNYTIPDSSDNSTNPPPSGQDPSTTTPAPEKLTVANVTLAKTSLAYTGKAQKPAITVKDASGKTVGAASYNAVFQNNKNVGTASVTLTFTGSYTGTVTKAFTILPKGTSISKLTAKKKGFTVKWKKQKTQTSGYELQYSTAKNFKSKKTNSNIKVNATSKTISKLKAKKKYYVRIRTYKTVGGKKYYSAWSKAKTVTTKAA